MQFLSQITQVHFGVLAMASMGCSESSPPTLPLQNQTYGHVILFHCAISPLEKKQKQKKGIKERRKRIKE